MLFSCKERGEKIAYSTGIWNADSLGYHRIVLRVEKKSNDVVAHIEWRRRDKDPEQKGFILLDGKTGQRIMNVTGININREAGDIVFQPVTVPGDYFLYYLPGKSSGRSNYPKNSLSFAFQNWRSGMGFKIHRYDIDWDYQDNTISQSYFNAGPGWV